MIEQLESRRLLASIGLDTAYANNGTAVLELADNGSIDTAAATPFGEVYLLGGSTVRAGIRGQYLQHVDTEGQLDSSFGTSGRVFVADPLDYSTDVPNDNRLAVNPGVGLVAVRTHEGRVLVYDRNGVAQTAVNTAIAAAYGNKQLLAAHATTFDPSNRLIIAGTFKVDASGTPRLAVARFNLNGTLDTSFGGGGLRVVTDETASNVDQKIQRVAASPSGAVAVVIEAHSSILWDDPYYSVDGAAQLSIVKADGRLASNVWVVDTSYSTDGGGAVSVSVADLRTVGRDRFAVAASAQFDGGAAVVDSNGEVISRNDDVEVNRFQTRLDSKGAILKTPDDATGELDPAVKAATNDISNIGLTFVLNDDTMLALGRAKGRTGASRTAIQKFDYAPPETNTTPGTVRLINHGTTLAVRGTDAADRIIVQYHAKSVHVVINGVLAGAFATKDFYDVRVDGGAGDDAIRVRTAVMEKSIYGSAGEGNDRVFADIFNGALHGDAGDDLLQSASPGASMLGDDGADTITGQGYFDGGAGDDLLKATGYANLNGGDGNDRLYAIDQGNAVTLTGNAGDDRLFGKVGQAFDGGVGTDIAFLDQRVDLQLLDIEAQRLWRR